MFLLLIFLSYSYTKRNIFIDLFYTVWYFLFNARRERRTARQTAESSRNRSAEWRSVPSTASRKRPAIAGCSGKAGDGREKAKGSEHRCEKSRRTPFARNVGPEERRKVAVDRPYQRNVFYLTRRDSMSRFELVDKVTIYGYC